MYNSKLLVYKSKLLVNCSYLLVIIGYLLVYISKLLVNCSYLLVIISYILVNCSYLLVIISYILSNQLSCKKSKTSKIFLGLLKTILFCYFCILFLCYGKAYFVSHFSSLLLVFWLVFGCFSSYSVGVFQCFWVSGS